MPRTQANRPSAPLPATSLCRTPDECAEAMKTLSDPNRILIVHALIPGPACVSEISARSGLSVHRVSHHLGRLRLTGIVTCTRQGRSIIYRIAESILSENGLNLGYCHVRFR